LTVLTQPPDAVPLRCVLLIISFMAVLSLVWSRDQ